MCRVRRRWLRPPRLLHIVVPVLGRGEVTALIWGCPKSMSNHDADLKLSGAASPQSPLKPAGVN